MLKQLDPSPSMAMGLIVNYTAFLRALYMYLYMYVGIFIFQLNTPFEALWFFLFRSGSLSNLAEI